MWVFPEPAAVQLSRISPTTHMTHTPTDTQTHTLTTTAAVQSVGVVEGGL